MNIVLVGFMGTGKSAVGRLLAGRLGWSFVDMDAVIEERAGKRIDQIFADEGEPAFRSREHALVSELALQDRLVIATGGGVVLNPDHVKAFSRTGRVVCLEADPEVLWQRVSASGHRPLLETPDKRERMLALLESRQPLYRAIPCRMDTTRLLPEQVADAVLALIA